MDFSGDLMPLPDANKKSPRVYPLLQNTDLENIAFATLQSTGTPIAIEEMNEDELRRLVLVNLARLSVKGEWSGLLTAASAGSFNVEITSGDDIDSTYSLNRIDSTPPWNTTTGNNSASARNEPMFYPFIAPETSTVDSIVVDIASAAGSTCNGIVAIYSDNNGVPQTKLGTDATFDATSTGQVAQASVGTISLTRGAQYWVGFTRSADVSFSWKCGAPDSWMGPTENLSSSWIVLWIASGSDNTLPSTITATDLTPRGYSRISVGLNQ
jgi:hypothetical protein